jgi:hypothetical protein
MINMSADTTVVTVVIAISVKGNPIHTACCKKIEHFKVRELAAVILRAHSTYPKILSENWDGKPRLKRI